MNKVSYDTTPPRQLGIVYFPTLWFGNLISRFSPSELCVFVFWNNLKTEVVNLHGDRYKIYDLNDPDGLAAYNNCDLIMADQAGFTMVRDRYQVNKDPNKLSVVFSHATDSPPLNFFSKNNLLISSSEYCSRASLEPLGRYIQASELDDVSIVVAYSGLYHINLEYCKNEFTRSKLLSKFSLHPERPIITCFIDEISDFKQVHIGLKDLSEHFNVLFKSYGTWSSLYQFTDLNLIDDASLNNLLRFGSDFILAGSHSGTLTTCAMLGLKVIPYHTETLFNNCKDREKYYKELKIDTVDDTDLNQLTTNFLPRHNWHNFQSVIKSLLITDTDRIVNLLNNENLWRCYKSTAKEWQLSSFGKYHLHDAADVVYSLVKSFFPGVNDTRHDNIITTIYK